MFTIEVKGLDKLVKDLRELGAVRIPNYLARALNDIGEEAKRAMLQDAQQNLTLRGSWFRTGNKYGFNRLSAATKSNLEVRVGSRAPWLYEQETTMFRTARKSFLTLPSPAVRPGGRTDPKKIPARFYPSRMGSKLFRIETKKGPVLAQRLKRAGLRIMYFLERSIHFPRRVHQVDAAKKAVQIFAPSVFEKSIAAAIREQGLK